MGTATEGTLIKILKELVGLRADLRDRKPIHFEEGAITVQPNGADARAGQEKMLAGMAALHPPIPLRPDDIRREGPPRPSITSEIMQKLHEADAEARANLPEPRPGHTWLVDLEPSHMVSSYTGALDFVSTLTLVYKQVRL